MLSVTQALGACLLQFQTQGVHNLKSGEVSIFDHKWPLDLSMYTRLCACRGHGVDMVFSF